MSKKQTSPQQFRAMVDFMVAHPDIGKGTSQQRPEEQNRLWEELSQKLDSISVPIRDVPAWKKVWRDYRSNTKKKMVTNKLQMEGTVGGPNKTVSLNDLEEVVSDLLSYDTAVSGLPNIQKYGVIEPESLSPLVSITSSDEITLVDDGDIDQTSSFEIKRTTSARKRKLDQIGLLQQQIDMQKSFYDNYIALKKEELSCLKKIADGIQLLKK